MSSWIARSTLLVGGMFTSACSGQVGGLSGAGGQSIASSAAETVASAVGATTSTSATTGGSGGAASVGSGGAGGTGGKPTMVAVGYAGLRVVSHDLGLTWTDRTIQGTGEDVGHLLDTVIYAKGMFLTSGHNPTIFTSPDGVTWTPHDNPGNDNHGLAYGNGLFVAVGWAGYYLKSIDGFTWTKGPQEIGTGTLRSACFGNGQFAAAGDDNIVWVSSDGDNWSVLPGLQTGYVAFCNGDFHDGAECLPQSGFGVQLRSDHGGPNNTGIIERSTDGVSWEMVYTDPDTQFYGSSTFAFGYAP